MSHICRMRWLIKWAYLFDALNLVLHIGVQLAEAVQLLGAGLPVAAPCTRGAVVQWMRRIRLGCDEPWNCRTTWAMPPSEPRATSRAHP